VRGRLIVHEPPGGRHGYVAANLAFRLSQHTDLTGAGAVFVGDVGFTLRRAPDTVRGPDVAFVSKDRLPQPIPNSYLELAPDLAVEVLSHTDRPGDLLAKVGDWLDAGARLVWVIDPERRLARVYRADGTESLLDETGRLPGEDVLPGFSCTLAAILG
jgi:Uma2 family endonuclease